jgi:hypothetical protein
MVYPWKMTFRTRGQAAQGLAGRPDQLMIRTRMAAPKGLAVKVEEQVCYLAVM